MRVRIVMVGVLCCFSAVMWADEIQDHWRRDPFELPDWGQRDPVSDRIHVACPNSLKLEGIMGDGERFYAFINGQVVGQGEVISGYRVSHVTAKGVTLTTQRYMCSLRKKF